MRFAKLPDNAYKKLQFGAGVLTSDFNPEVGALALASILGATTGGINFVATPTYVDRGSDAENLPSDVKELKDLVSWKVTLSGTYISATSALFKTLMGAADASNNNGLSHVVPRNSLDLADFKTLWWIGDYSEDNSAGSGRFIAIKLTNALSTQGISLKSSNKGLGEYPFEFTAHCTYADRQVPYELFMVESESPAPTAQYQEKQVTPANYQLKVSADAGYVALSRVIVKAIELSSLPTITSNGTYTTSEAGFSSPVVVNVAGGSALQSKTVTPTAAQQVVIPDSGYDALSQVTVNAAPLQAKSATPTTAAQTISPDGTNIGLSAVSVGAVTSAIDSGITAGNIKSGVVILGVTGTYTDSGDAVAGDIRNGKKAWVDGAEVTGNVAVKSGADLTVSGKTVTVPAGIYDSQAQKSVADGAATPNATVSGAVIGDNSSSYPVTVTPKASVGTPGYISSISDGSLVTKYVQTESKNATPSGSEQTITPTAGKLLHSVVVAAVNLTGNAAESDVMAGKTFYSNSTTKKTGTLTVPSLSLTSGVLSIS